MEKMRIGPYEIVEGHDYQFPVIGYERRSLSADGVAAPKNIYGTAFSIGNDCFITAGHSITAAASESDVIGIAFIADGRYFLAEALEYEVLPELDVCFLRTTATIGRAKAYPWERDRIPALATVMACGYPFAIDPELHGISTRVFKGHIVSRKPFPRFSAKPWVYELSFASPAGLSGAPLVAIDGNPRIAGVILGNYETKMLVLSDKEIISEQTVRIVDTYHALQLGIAIQSTELLGLKSKVLPSGDLSSHLTHNHLLSAM